MHKQTRFPNTSAPKVMSGSEAVPLEARRGALEENPSRFSTFQLGKNRPALLLDVPPPAGSSRAPGRSKRIQSVFDILSDLGSACEIRHFDVYPEGCAAIEALLEDDIPDKSVLHPELGAAVAPGMAV